MKIGKYAFDFFSWIKRSELVELDRVDPTHDPVRPELSNEFRKEKGRKIFGLKYKDYIEGVVCVAYTDDIPTTVKELDLMSKDAMIQAMHRAGIQGHIAIAYTVWAKKRGGGKAIVNEDTQNFEYDITLEDWEKALDKAKRFFRIK